MSLKSSFAIQRGPQCQILQRFHILFAVATFLCVHAPPTDAADDARPATTTEPAAVRCPITRDTWVSNVGDEADGSNGGAAQLKVKSIQEMTLFDIDPAPLRGHAIRRASLHVHLSGKERLHRISISTIAAEWTEGTATGYAKQQGSSTFNWRNYPSEPWSFPHSDLTSVVLGQGGTIWRMADATDPDAQGWQHIAIDPSVLAARVAGVSFGFLVFDDTGSEWTHQGDRFNLRLFPNRYFNSRDSNRQSAPYITVELGDADLAAPGAPTELKQEIPMLPANEAEVSWLTPADEGAAGTIGFIVRHDGQIVPRYLVPMAGAPGQRATMRLRDLPKGQGKSHLEVSAVDGAGNVGKPASMDVELSTDRNTAISGTSPTQFTANVIDPQPKLGDAVISVIDALDKMQPITGKMIPPHDDAYLKTNHLWDGARRLVRLQGARGEIVAFQVVLSGPVTHAVASLIFDGKAAGPKSHFYQLGYIPSAAGPMPDPLLPLGEGISIPGDGPLLQKQQNASLYVEVEVPHGATPGPVRGSLSLRADDGKAQMLDVELTVLDLTMPDALGFLPEMNCYGLPVNETDYYRLAHSNRTVLNRVPYHHNGEVHTGCAPAWDGKTLDFTEWDKRFGPLFDGSDFAQNARGAQPVECFYLPMFENWPTPMAGNYNESYWADQAFTPAYRAAWVSVARQFAEHANAKGWNRTIFQCFLNGKNNFKAKGWSHSTCPWLLDEPANFQDFWALRWFGRAFHEGADGAAGSAMMCFRADVSRPQWQRDSLDAVLDYCVVGGDAFNQYNRAVTDRKQRFGQVVIPYGGTNDLHQSNVQPVGWCIDVWLKGGDGVLPWQTIGNAESWQKADALSLFYPGESIGLKGPVASIRLKSYLRGEQDVEYLIMLARQLNVLPADLASSVRQIVKLDAQRKGTGFAGEDAGMIDFESLTPQAAWELRTRIAAMLKAGAAPIPAPRWQIPHRPPDKIPPAIVEGS